MIIFAIEIDKRFTLQQTRFDARSTYQTNFFVHREQTFDRTMLDIVGSQNSQSHCYGNTIIGTQSRTASAHPIVFHIKIDGILFEIVLHIVVLFTNHIDMSLQNNRFGIFSASRSRLTDDNVSGFIVNTFQTMFLCEIQEPLLCFLGFERRTGNFTKFLKIMPYRGRLQIVHTICVKLFYNKSFRICR